jgi:hypothetical protein
MSLPFGAGSYDWDCSPAHLEADVLGCLLARPDAEAGEVIDRLSEEAFNHPHLRAIYHAIRTLRADGVPADPVAVTDRMRAQGTLTDDDPVCLCDLAGVTVAPSILRALVEKLRTNTKRNLAQNLARALFDAAESRAPDFGGVAALLRHIADHLDDGRPDAALHMLLVYRGGARRAS